MTTIGVEHIRNEQGSACSFKLIPYSNAAASDAACVNAVVKRKLKEQRRRVVRKSCILRQRGRIGLLTRTGQVDKAQIAARVVRDK